MAKVVFNNKNAIFYQSLRKSVDNYFSENQIRKTGNPRLYTKTAVLLTAAILLYLLLLLTSLTLLQGILLSSMLGLTLASIGFNVMHDACHGAYSSRPWINELFGLTLNALGGNSFIWRQKHNIIHHTYTNIDGIDDDIAKAPVIRQCQTQPWKSFHRVQHLYLPVVYSISSIAWVFIFDIVKYMQRRIYTTELQRMSFKDHVIFWASKAMYIIFYIVIPVKMVGCLPWLTGFVCMHIAMGLTLALVFQLAHVVGATEFRAVQEDETRIENEWAIHQVNTTANFAPGNKVISWFVGGLNYQIEHHLFPKISHVHYPAISHIVKDKCQEFGITYNEIPRMSDAIASHFRFMRELGKRPLQNVTA